MPETPDLESIAEADAEGDTAENLEMFTPRIFQTEDEDDPPAEEVSENDTAGKQLEARNIASDEDILADFNLLWKDSQEHPENYPNALLVLLANIQAIMHTQKGALICALSCADESTDETLIALRTLSVVMREANAETTVLLGKLSEDQCD